MRISSSSSVILATLAVSSSSSVLAAPADARSSSLATDSSMHSVAVAGRAEGINVDYGMPDTNVAVPGASVHMDHAATSYSQDGNWHNHYARDGLPDLLGLVKGLPLVGPVLDPLVTTILGLLGLQQKTGTVTSAAASVPAAAPNAQQLAALAQLLGQAHSQVAALSLAQRRDVQPPNPTSVVAGKTSMVLGKTSSLPTPTGAKPKTPLPTGATPPSGPISNDAPPMFPNFTAADAPTTSPDGGSSSSTMDYSTSYATSSASA